MIKYNDALSDQGILEQVEQTKDKALCAQEERVEYLGELKERVIIALTKNQVNEPGVYTEITNALLLPETKNLIISRDVSFLRIKEYITLAEQHHINHKIVDGIQYRGNVGLVISSDEALTNQRKDIFVKSDLDKILEKNLPRVYYDAIGKKICLYHHLIIVRELPELKNKYRLISVIDSFFGAQCPICKKLGGKKHG